MRTHALAQPPSQPVVSVQPRGDGVRIYATIMPTAEKVRLLKLALAYLETATTQPKTQETTNGPQSQS